MVFIACLNPLFGVELPNIKTANGKNAVRIVPRFYVYDGKYSEMKENSHLSLKSHWVDSSTGEVGSIFTIPCGKCVGCRLDYSRSWADRCVLESKLYPEEQCTFLTITYDDYHLTYDDVSGQPSLNPKDLTDFLKRLREKIYRYYGSSVRFYACGEYGDIDARPHFHILLFGFEFKDMKYRGTSKSGDPMYSSDFLSEVWGKGYCWIGELNWKTCAYTARYVMKKQKGPNAEEYYSTKGVTPEFVRMSNRPGIGAGYFDKFKDKIYKNDEIIIPNGSTVLVHKPPEYFDRLLERENPALIESIKKLRQEYNENFNAIQVELAQTDLDAAGYFELKNREKTKSIKSLQRQLKGVCNETY